MASWQPDPSFYPSPRMAAKAPTENLAYVAAFDPDRKRPDAIAVVDVDPKLGLLRQDRRPGGHAECRRRAAPFRLERLLLLPVPERAAPAYRAPLPGGAGAALLAHPHHRHQAGPEEPEDRPGDRARGDRREGRLQPHRTPSIAGRKASMSTRSAMPRARRRAASS